MTRIDVVSDPICPWCYIGAANLVRALGVRDPHPFAIRWRPFRLNPAMPPEGMDRAAYLASKFGGAENAARLYARVEAAAADAGVAVDFGRIARTPDSLDAHRLIRWAGVEAAQTRVAMALFRRYFEAGEDISNAAVLVATAEEAGLDGAAIGRLLAGEADRAEVRAEADAAAESGITGVPTFIVGERYAVRGAQPVDLWTRLIDELAGGAPG